MPRYSFHQLLEAKEQADNIARTAEQLFEDEAPEHEDTLSWLLEHEVRTLASIIGLDVVYRSQCATKPSLNRVGINVKPNGDAI